MSIRPLDVATVLARRSAWVAIRIPLAAKDASEAESEQPAEEGAEQDVSVVCDGGYADLQCQYGRRALAHRALARRAAGRCGSGAWTRVTDLVGYRDSGPNT